MENGISRRGFLGVFGMMAAAATAAVVVPERRFWQVGASLVRPSDAQVLSLSHGHTYNAGVAFDLGAGKPGLAEQQLGRARRGRFLPMADQPGLWKDTVNGHIINERQLEQAEQSIWLTEQTNWEPCKKMWVFQDGGSSFALAGE
jgi:hypothetical protein